MKKDTTPVVEAIGELNFEGNIIPHSWYQHIKLPVGKRELKRKEGERTPKADHIAIILLSDVIYWYRPTIRRDELTGAVVSIEKKFYEDMLQKQYETWGVQFGFTKSQTRDAVSRLVKAGLLKREFRSIISKGGIKLNNIMFVEPVIESIKRITFTHPETHTIIEQLPPYHVQTPEVSRLNVAPTSFKVDTNTKTTTETTTKNAPISSEIGAQTVFLEQTEQTENPTLPVNPGHGGDNEELHYTRLIVKHFNTLHEQYPDKISKDVTVPRKIESLTAKKYDTVCKWYASGRTADEVCDALSVWVTQLKTTVGGLNFFAQKPFPLRKSSKEKVAKEYDATKRLLEKLK